MREAWDWGLTCFSKSIFNKGVDDLKRQAVFVRAVKDQMLNPIASVADLESSYDANLDSHRSLVIAKHLFPAGVFDNSNVNRCTAASYGLRYAEIMTNKVIDPLALPGWIGEWSAWST